MDSEVYAELKARAAREHRTLAEIIERTLRIGLEQRPRSRPLRVRLPSYDLGPFLIDPADRTRGAGGGSEPAP